jgi:hypothetical protein
MSDDKIPTLASALAADDNVQAAKKLARETEAKIRELNTQIENFGDDVKGRMIEELSGSLVGNPFLEAYISEKTKPFVRKLNAYNDMYSNQIAVLNDATEQATTSFEVKEYNKTAQLQAYQFMLGRLDTQNAVKQAQSNADRAYQLQLDQFSFEKTQGKDVPIIP